MMTWGEFKRMIEEQGVEDSFEVTYFDCDGYGPPRVTIRRPETSVVMVPGSTPSFFVE